MKKEHLAVEQLRFQVNPDRIEQWIALDHEIWTKGLEQWPGFSSKEVWVSADRPGEVITVIYWDDYELWKAVDTQWLKETDQRFCEQFGVEDMKFIEGMHEKNQFYKVCSHAKGEDQQ